MHPLGFVNFNMDLKLQLPSPKNFLRVKKNNDTDINNE